MYKRGAGLTSAMEITNGHRVVVEDGMAHVQFGVSGGRPSRLIIMDDPLAMSELAEALLNAAHSIRRGRTSQPGRPRPRLARTNPPTSAPGEAPDAQPLPSLRKINKSNHLVSPEDELKRVRIYNPEMVQIGGARHVRPGVYDAWSSEADGSNPQALGRVTSLMDAARLIELGGVGQKEA